VLTLSETGIPFDRVGGHGMFAQWGTMFRQDMQAWGELVRTAGITPD
jgi:hypothetical protein